MSQILVAFLYIAVAREAGPGPMGAAVSTIAAVTFVAGIIDFGGNTLWVRERVSEAYSPEALYGRMIMKTVYTLVLATTFTAIAVAIWPATPYCYAGALLLSIVFYHCSTVPLKAGEAITSLSIITFLEKAIALGMFSFLHLMSLQAHISLIISLTAGFFIAGLISCCLAPRSHRPRRKPDIVYWPWKGTLSYGVGSVTISAQSLDTVILHGVAGPVAAGIYGAVNRWTQPLSVFASSFATVGLPIVARTGSLRGTFAQLKYAWILLGLAAILCLAVAVSSPWIVEFLLGPQYSESSNVLAVLALGTIAALFNQPLYVFIQAMRLEKMAAIAMSTLVPLQLAGCALLSYYLGEMGAAIALAAFQFILLLTFYFILSKKSDERVTMRSYQSRGVALLRAK